MHDFNTLKIIKTNKYFVTKKINRNYQSCVHFWNLTYNKYNSVSI